ncbi:MAG: glycoside hydrolase family 32 protein [Bacteroidia bacterium]|nr:glycoside hydrolase family 32 protein [Bacteroidia bacterium]
MKAAVCLLPLLLLAACAPPPAAPASGTDEPHRPRFHFTPDSMWMNDPNGLVYFDGEYHLFYQHYPDSTVWGPMHWGHAVSRDLLRWEHLPIALYPDSLGYIFSGSAVADSANTSGFGAAGQIPLVAIFTHHDPAGERAGRDDFQYQSLAYSLDRGRSWTKYRGNPVLPNPGIRDFRDPKVIWHAPSRRWVMVLAAKDRIHFYTSPNLREWTFASEFGAGEGAHGGVWECPDLFELPVDGGPETQWVLLVSINPGGPNGGSATQYFAGTFDGTRFIPGEGFGGQQAHWMDAGRDNYAGVTWSGIPQADGRRILIGWMSNWDYAQTVPTRRWRSAMTLPRSLHLRRTPGGLRLASWPVEEAARLRGPAVRTALPALADRHPLPASGALRELELALSWPGPAPAAAGVVLENDRGESLRIGYQPAEQQYVIDRGQAPRQAFSPKFAGIQTAPRIAAGDTVRMRLIFDAASAELFADGGLTVMTSIFFPEAPFTRAYLFREGGGDVQAAYTEWPLQPVR